MTARERAHRLVLFHEDIPCSEEAAIAAVIRDAEAAAYERAAKELDDAAARGDGSPTSLAAGMIITLCAEKVRRLATQGEG